MLFDTHAHFDSFDEAGAAAAVKAALAAGVQRIVAVGGTAEANRAARALALRCPGTVLGALGWDRDQAARLGLDAATLDAAMASLMRDLSSEGTVAVGEMGLDFHYSPQTADAQVELFRRQVRLAADVGLPVVVHSREADGPTLAVLREFACLFRGGPGGVLHCFTGSAAFAAALVELGLHVSFSGIVSFRKADALRDVVRQVPDDRLLIETDTPYLAPEPHRGRRNEPALLVHVAEAVARARGCSVEDLAAVTTANAERLFRGRAAGYPSLA